MKQWVERLIDVDGVRLATFEFDDPAGDTSAVAGAGNPADPDGTDAADRPTVLFVHGWPDTHHVWTEVAERLSDDFRVVAYDTRGLGVSDNPRGVSAYRIETLADDLYAVAAAVSPDAPVHVVAHDWGSIQSWEAMSRPDATDHFASFTTISGPCLDHVGVLLRENISHPTPRRALDTLLQSFFSTYIVLLHLPFGPTLISATLGSPGAWRRFLRLMDGTPAEQIVTAPSLRNDMRSGARYYRANMVRKVGKPNPRTTHVPVLEMVNTRDFAVRTHLLRNTNRFAPDLTRLESPTPHWAPTTNPGYVADSIREFVRRIAARTSTATTPDRAAIR
ncbi:MULTISPECIES: alpha/beta fold hydrolase [Gordonia]|uniref:Putative hydrolase n=1 Tax=Gordonia sputi NBRC 100414 TaxID=1089453 RepID=H5TV53_9ACTN|nr:MULTISPECIES: alpha/beta fold hydrolase [Gordonia]NKY95496.1 alpha/beta fold hydrolase [Gordonia sputi]GAB37361.1 putative hydrolase [Gordonia sputi NBRC 100414]